MLSVGVLLAFCASKFEFAKDKRAEQTKCDSLKCFRSEKIRRNEKVLELLFACVGGCHLCEGEGQTRADDGGRVIPECSALDWDAAKTNRSNESIHRRRLPAITPLLLPPIYDLSPTTRYNSLNC